MSKLQKALQRLRDNNQGAAAAPRPESKTRPPDGAGKDGAVWATRRSRLPQASEHPIAEPAEGGFSARHRVEVDPEELRAMGLIADEGHEELIGQEFRRIKRPILRNAFDSDIGEGKNGNVVMIASALPRTGKTFCSINLAASISRERDIGAVLVDADVLKPNVSKAFNVVDHVGLIDLLVDPNIGIDDVLVATDFHGLLVVPAGSEHQEATELLASRRMEAFTANLSERFPHHVIIFDTPPLLLTNEAHVLAEHMGQIVMVIEAGVSTQDSVVQALSSLNRSKPINAVLNKARGGSFGSYDKYGYDYYPVRDSTDEDNE